MPNVGKNQEVANLSELKAAASKVLPATSQLRSIILSLPNRIPRVEAVAKLEILVDLLYGEFRSQSKKHSTFIGESFWGTSK